MVQQEWWPRRCLGPSHLLEAPRNTRVMCSSGGDDAAVSKDAAGEKLGGAIGCVWPLAPVARKKKRFCKDELWGSHHLQKHAKERVP